MRKVIIAMTSNENSRELDKAVKAIATVTGLMVAIFTLLGIFLPTSLTQPIGALVIGLIFTAILVWIGKLKLGMALVAWLVVSMGIIILYLIVSRPASIAGSVVDSSGSPVKGLTLILTDANGVDHKTISDENGAFEINNVSEGKFTVSTNGELLISGRVPSGWKRIVDTQINIGSPVYRHGSSVAVTPTIVAIVTSDTPTPMPIVSPTSTSIAIPTDAPTEADVVQPKPTFTAIPVPTDTSVPKSGSRPACRPSEHTSLGSGFSGNMSELTTAGAVKIYSHCPPVSPIQYDDVSVDDDLAKVELVCSDNTNDITERFSYVSIAGEMLPHYKSDPIEIPSGCRIDFTVKDNVGGNIAISFRATGSPPPSSVVTGFRLCNRDDAGKTFAQTDASTGVTRINILSSAQVFFISTDPATITFSPNSGLSPISLNGKTQYVILGKNVPGLEWIEIDPGYLYTACIYSLDQFDLAKYEAGTDMTSKKAGNTLAEYYSIDGQNIELIESFP